MGANVARFLCGYRGDYEDVATEPTRATFTARPGTVARCVVCGAEFRRKQRNRETCSVKCAKSRWAASSR